MLSVKLDWGLLQPWPRIDEVIDFERDSLYACGKASSGMRKEGRFGYHTLEWNDKAREDRR